MSRTIKINAASWIRSPVTFCTDWSAATGETIPAANPHLPSPPETRELVDPDGFLQTVQHLVLIAEDRESNAEALRILLESLGCETVVAHDGPTALAVLREKRVDLAIIDIGLPGMDGWKVARTITQEMRDPPRLIALSGFGEQTDIDESLRCGFSEHIVKPIRLEQLQQILGDPDPGAAT